MEVQHGIVWNSSSEIVPHRQKDLADMKSNKELDLLDMDGVDIFV